MTYFRVLIISLIFHLVLALLISLVPVPSRLDLKQESYVDLLEKPELPARPKQLPKDEKQFVRSAQVPKELLTDKRREARFASEDEQFVLQETRARNTDMTKNRSLAPLPSSRSQAREVAPAKKSKGNGRAKSLDFHPQSPLDRAKEEIARGETLDTKRAASNGDVEVAEKKQAADRSTASSPVYPSIPSFEQGMSTLGEAVPDDIKFGDFTALNTDRHLYYSFYARMEEKIRGRWVTYVRAAIYNMPGDPIRQTGKDGWVTKLEVILDPQGHFQKAILFESSGIRSLDSAPVQAFKDAGQFPNPPAEMVKADGSIHVYYAFNVSMGGSRYAGRGED